MSVRDTAANWCPGWFLDGLCPVTPDELAKIRGLDDFDLTLFVSELHDHGWSVAAVTLELMPDKRASRHEGFHGHLRCVQD